ncbi:hypothetical protein AAG570_008052 [Ranatra chinensis]|uniref:Protein VAC14 homolog n=1 Tax=Ranatra chinensis TaxID=642074 RepID=A0ABD0YC77_9HEMI
MSERDYAPLSVACVRALIDKQYEKRKAAASEIEKMVKDFVEVNKMSQIKKLLKVLGHEFAMSQNANYRKGGLIGLAAVAVALGKDSSGFTETLIKPILLNFSDNDLRIRYYACESLYNVVKVARGAVLPYFSDIFKGLSKLVTDPDQSVKNGSELLDRLMKDIVTESAAFDLYGFMPLLRERLYSPNPFAKQFIISWISVLDAVPDIQLVLFLPEILDGLFHMLSDTTVEVKCTTVLEEFLRSINKDPSQVDFVEMINILITRSQASDYQLQLTAITWIRDFILLSGEKMLPFTSGILLAILHCLAHEGEPKNEIRETAKVVNASLMDLITSEQDFDETAITQNKELDLEAILDVLTKKLLDVSVQIKVASLKWIYHLHTQIPKRMLCHIDVVFPVLLKNLSDHSDDVVLHIIHVVSQIILRSAEDAAIDNNLSPYFTKFLCSLIKLFSLNGQLLEDKGPFIIRQLCVLLNAEDIYCSAADILRKERDLKFARVMVDTLNTILLTSSELFLLRNKLKNQEGGNILFQCIYETWCHNPVATIALCLLTQNYAHTSDLINILSNYEITVEFLAEIDRLIQLIESPIFTHLRLQMLEVPYNVHLIRAMYGLLMILPQSESFHILRHRLDCIPKLHFYDNTRSV